MKPLRIILITVVTVALLTAWLATVDLRGMARAIAEASPIWIAVAGAFSVLHLFVRAIRWRSILGDARGPAELTDLWRYTAIGYAVTFAIPGRVGEVVRPALLWRRAGTPFGLALGSIVLERVLDIATLAAMLAAFAVLAPEQTPAGLRPLAFALLAGAVGGVVALALVARHFSAGAARLIIRLTAWLPARVRDGVRALLTSLIAAFERIATLRAGARLAVLSLLTWTPVLITIVAGLRATGVTCSAMAPLAMAPLTALGIAVPTPAGVGGYHAAMTWGLTHLLGVDAGRAAAAAVVTHGASILPVIAIGLYACWREGLSLSALRRQATEATATETPQP